MIIDDDIIKNMVNMALSRDIDNHTLLSNIMENEPYNYDKALIVLLCMASTMGNGEHSIFAFLASKYEELWSEFCNDHYKLWDPYILEDEDEYIVISHNKCIEIYNKLKQIQWKTSII